MIHFNEKHIRDEMRTGNFGLERESLRVTSDGMLSHTPHPFPDDSHIVRDFCENQTEINTGVHTSVQGAVAELQDIDRRLRDGMNQSHHGEVLWAFSNPPYIRDEMDIPVAEFTGVLRGKTLYRDYLSGKYGRYKMTFSGIHVNFSFSEKLLQHDFSVSESIDYRSHKDRIYLDLAQGLVEFGWILTALTAASPLVDGSFFEKGVTGKTVFTGMASYRCSEMGYWNDFVPVLDYSDLQSYVSSIRRYVQEGWLRSPSELYYPIRLKSLGENNLDVLQEKGVSHIELRMFDLNPLVPWGLDERDVIFAHLLMLWISSRNQTILTEKDQIRAAGNFKRAAHFDLDSVNYTAPDGTSVPMRQAGLMLIEQMKPFFSQDSSDALEILEYEYTKLVDPTKRYAWIVKNQFEDNFAVKGLQLAKERQE